MLSIGIGKKAHARHYFVRIFPFWSFILKMTLTNQHWEKNMLTRNVTGACIISVALVLFFSASRLSANEGAGSGWSVQEAVRVALASSPDSKMAVQRIEAARAAIEAEKAAFYPKFSLQSQYSQTDNPLHSFGNILNQGEFDQSIDFNDPGRTDNLQLAVRVGYSIYSGGLDQAGLVASLEQKRAAEMGFAAVQDQLAFEVVRAFHFIVQNEGLVQAFQASVEAAAETLAVAKARYDAGDLLLSDLLDLEVQHSQVQEDLIHMQHRLEISRLLFLNLLGGQEGPVIIDHEADLDQKIPKLLSAAERPEVRVMDAMIGVAEARIRQAQAGRYPKVEGFAGYEIDKGSELGGSGDSWQAGVMLHYDLFDGNRTSSEIVKARAFLAEARERKRKTELDIRLDVEKANFAVNEAERRLEVTEKIVEHAKESAAINRARFKEGLVLSSDLIAGENRLTNALVRRTQAEASRAIAVADLRRAVGEPQFPGMQVESLPQAGMPQ